MGSQSSLMWVVPQLMTLFADDSSLYQVNKTKQNKTTPPKKKPQTNQHKNLKLSKKELVRHSLLRMLCNASCLLLLRYLLSD